MSTASQLSNQSGAMTTEISSKHSGATVASVHETSTECEIAKDTTEISNDGISETIMSTTSTPKPLINSTALLTSAAGKTTEVKVQQGKNHSKVSRTTVG